MQYFAMKAAPIILRNLVRALSWACFGLFLAILVWAAATKLSMYINWPTRYEVLNANLMPAEVITVGKSEDTPSETSLRLTANEVQSEQGYVQLKELTTNHQFKKELIFFIETSGRASLNVKSLCAIESAALHHPEKLVVCVMLARRLHMTPEIQALLRAYPNIVICSGRLKELVTFPPALRGIVTSHGFSSSKFRTNHGSDILRMALLWQFGGTYLDLDMLVVQRFPTDDEAFLAAQDKQHINGAILSFPKHHPALEHLLNATAASRRKKWGSIGPLLLTRVLKRLCHLTGLESPGSSWCPGLRIYPPAKFYPVHGSHARQLFQRSGARQVMVKVKQSFTVHLWGRLTRDFALDGAGSQQPYAQLAHENCPVLHSFV